jgi:hypothetical protein
MKRVLGLFICLCFALTVHAGDSSISDLEDLTLTADSFWNGSGLEGSYEATDTFSSGSATLNNYYAYDADFMYSSWRWFAYSNITDTASSGFGAQYNAIPGGGENGSAYYVVGYCDQWAQGSPVVTFSSPQTVADVYITNSNYAYYSMRDGDGFAKKFGGLSGDDQDWFLLTITGKDADVVVTGSVEFYLADFRFADNGQDYIVDTWEAVNLNGLGQVNTLEFSLTSSDTGMYGMNTPAYFCLDTIDGTIDFENLTLAAESYWNGSGLEGSYTAADDFTSGIATYANYYAYDKEYMYTSWSGFSYSNLQDTTTDGLNGQYMAIPGLGARESDIYAIGYCNTFAAVQPELELDEAQIVSGIYITNSNYAYYSMLNGDAFAKQFEAGDWFKLTITGKDGTGTETGSVEFLLADGTDIVDTWEWIDLRSLGEVKTLEFSLASSDTGMFGMNTPAYFALDSLNDPGENDRDDDGDGITENEGDCDDTDDSIYPGADEICGDGIDQDCDGNDLACPVDDDDDDDDEPLGCFIKSLI